MVLISDRHENTVGKWTSMSNPLNRGLSKRLRTFYCKLSPWPRTICCNCHYRWI